MSLVYFQRQWKCQAIILFPYEMLRCASCDGGVYMKWWAVGVTKIILDKKFPFCDNIGDGVV